MNDNFIFSFSCLALWLRHSGNECSLFSIRISGITAFENGLRYKTKIVENLFWSILHSHLCNFMFHLSIFRWSLFGVHCNRNRDWRLKEKFHQEMLANWLSLSISLHLHKQISENNYFELANFSFTFEISLRTVFFSRHWLKCDLYPGYMIVLGSRFTCNCLLHVIRIILLCKVCSCSKDAYLRIYVALVFTVLYFFSSVFECEGNSNEQREKNNTDQTHTHTQITLHSLAYLLTSI